MFMKHYAPTDVNQSGRGVRSGGGGGGGGGVRSVAGIRVDVNQELKLL